MSYVVLSLFPQLSGFAPKIGANFWTNVQGVAVFALAMLALSFAIYYALRKWFKNKPLRHQIIAYAAVFIALVLYITYTLGA